MSEHISADSGEVATTQHPSAPTQCAEVDTAENHSDQEDDNNRWLMIQNNTIGPAIHVFTGPDSGQQDSEPPRSDTPHTELSADDHDVPEQQRLN